MYNENLKLRFIKYYTSSVARAEVCASLFKATESFEQEYDSDVYAFPIDKLEPMVEQLVGMRVRSRWQRIIILKDYVRWCLASGISGVRDDIFHMEINGLDKVKTQTVSSPTHLQKCLDEICEPESEQATDNIYRCYYWMAYGGMDEEDILNVKCSDVCFDGMYILYNGYKYPLYREAIPAFKNACTLSQFRYKHPNYPDKIVWKDRAQGNTVVRGTKALATVFTIRTELSRRSRKNAELGRTDVKLSYYRAWISGLFYRMFERERAGIPVDFSGVAAQFMQGKTYKLDSGRNTTEAKRRQVSNDYMQDYLRWKAAYSI